MFIKARPVFADISENEMHILVDFHAEVGSLVGTELHICAADFYRVYINGKFVAFGPARAAKGYAREDVISLGSFGSSDKNEIVISVLSHHCHSLSTVYQPPFLMAEIVRNGEVILCTGRDFECMLSSCHEQKTERYSIQRHFGEVWDMRKSGKQKHVDTVILKNAPKIIERRAPYPFYEDIICDTAKTVGRLKFDASVIPKRDKYSFLPSEFWGRFERDEIVSHPHEWIQVYGQHMTDKNVTLPTEIGELEYAIFDFSRIEVGFIMLEAEAIKEADIIIAFSEDASAEKFEFTNINCQNVVEVMLPVGDNQRFLSFEPYVMRYAIVAVCSGTVRLDSFGIKNFSADVSGVKIPDIENPVLRNVYRAAVRTFAHNAVDLYMDCPSRERAGWLCDSYFTAKTEYELFGKSDIESAFLENYRLYQNEGEYPVGVLPMCYPSDVQENGKFIPQWTMWYILEIEDYINNRGNSEHKELFRASINGLLEFYEKHENEFGLLEKLPSWNFVEWSVANDWTQDVSYPSNFLYAQVLECVYKIYGDIRYLAKAQQVRRIAIEQSFNGQIFLDHSIRGENGSLVRQAHSSEACQYYAILFAGIDINEEKYSHLGNLVKQVFGADREILLDEIAPINAFIGAYLRLEVLLKMEEYALVLRDIENFFGNMESQTGTLWEYRQKKGSRDHGFASYALVAINKALKSAKK